MVDYVDPRDVKLNELERVINQYQVRITTEVFGLWFSLRLRSGLGYIIFSAKSQLNIHLLADVATNYISLKC